ncbi:type II CAAX endopeptidase family protein [Paenibacillus koleovorans]|uniref:type II CAAX endopeptidase family protein n=1 Tax=Paenibacillus koleovorans TaxID=121608 RepID=UPI000FDC0A71|nr:type II CAAX endopeptidase family protein [Paenibacillus koleovorans]
MKKFNFKQIKFRVVKAQELTDQLLILNLYVTQVLTLIVGIAILFFQSRNPIHLFRLPEGAEFALWGVLFAAVVLGVDALIGRFVPEEVTDDGGINQLLFGKRALWHIAVISFIVSVCEELLFRGAIQHAFGPYWTSILFAAIHIRYLKHWLMTGLVFSISYGLGWIYIQTNTLWTPIVAHFIIDFVMGCIIRYGRKS